MPGVDVLSQQRDLARALRDQSPRLGDHRGCRPAALGAACVGHHAEAAEPVAALLDSQECGDPLRRGRVGQEVEFLLGRKIGLDHRPAGAGGTGHHLGQPMVGLRTQDDIDIRRARQDFVALRLRHAACDRQDHPSARRGTLLLEPPQPAKFGEHLLGGLVADVAGIEDHHVGVLRHRRRRIAQRSQYIGHPGAVIDVHLTAPGDDVQALRASLPLARRCRGCRARGAGQALQLRFVSLGRRQCGRKDRHPVNHSRTYSGIRRFRCRATDWGCGHGPILPQRRSAVRHRLPHRMRQRLAAGEACRIEGRL